ncbi:MAG: magnesium/cobalt transporter CorA [archaeon]
MIEIFYLDKTLKMGTLKTIDSDKPVWIDTKSLTIEEAKVLGDIFDLHPLTIEDLRALNTRVKVEEFPNYMLSIFYGITNHKKLGLIEIDFIIGTNFVITSHDKTVASFDELKKDKTKLEALLRKGPEFLFHKLLDGEMDNYFPVLELLDEELDKIEELVVKNPKPLYLTRILNLKRQLRHIKKAGYQQRDKISYLAKNEYKFISKKALPYFRDVYDHAIRISDSIDNYREAISEAFDAYMSAVNNNMNEVMKVLSIIATMALPMTVISGIYGTNFKNLPGSENPYGFWAMILFMVIFSFSMLYMFRKRHWFG